MLNGETLVAEAGGARGALPTLAPLVVETAAEAAGEPSLRWAASRSPSSSSRAPRRRSVHDA